MKDRLTFTVGSDREREDLVADLFCDNTAWGEINNESGQFEIVLYPNPKGGAWSFKLDQFLELIDRARDRLVQLRRR